MRLAPPPRGPGLFLPTLFVMSAQNQVMDSSMTSMSTFKGPKWAIDEGIDPVRLREVREA